MSILNDYGEFLICILPPFLVIAAIGLGLLANSWPPWEDRKPDDKEPD